MWGVMLARLIPSIVYVRDRLRMEKGKDFSRVVPIGLHVAALIGVAALAYFRLSPLLPVLMMAFLLGRAVQGMSPLRQKATAKQIGVQEVIYGCVTVLTVVIGYYFGV
jgi:positive regulator of sigma E activity